MRMIYDRHSRAVNWIRALALAALVAGLGACGGEDELGPSGETPVALAPTDSTAPADSTVVPLDSTLAPADSTLPPTDSLSLPPTDSAGAAAAAAGTQPGIVFGSYGMYPEHLNSVHTGSLRGGGITPENILSLLAAVRAKRGRIVLKLSMGKDQYVQNADKTFSLTKWKGWIDRFRKVNLGPYISDGTLMGHFIIDEPQRAAKWGGKIITQATVEGMAQYSKAIWPTLPTFARVVPSWLASAPVTYRALDAGWLQYASGKGNAAQLVAAEATVAKSKGLGLLVGLNILDGGNGSSKVRGWRKNMWAMSAAEIRSYGTALLNHSYACGFFNWTYQYHGPGYYARADINSAMTELSNKAKAHARTSCRQ